MSILLTILVIFLVAFIAFWLVDAMRVPDPINMVLKIVIGVIALVALLTKSGLVSGSGLGL